jgi:cytosine/creatinine deaminase
LAFPAADLIVLRNARVPDAVLADPQGVGLRAVDIVIADGRVSSVVPIGQAPPPGAAVRDMDGGIVLPAFVDIHTHLDKGHIWPRCPNPDGTWMNALLSVKADREGLWNAEDVERRMEFSLRSAYAHGTAAIRTHIDSNPPQHEISWDLFERVRERWAGRIELQGVSLISPHQLVESAVLDVVAKRARAAGGILGGAMAEFHQSKQAMFAVVEKAGEYGLDIDLHTDESLDPAASALLHLAEAVLETGYRGRVAAGHCCVLTVQDRATQQRTIAKVAEAGIGIVSLPMCNMYLMERDGTGGATPIRRGVTLVKELAAAGVPVALASDNTRDPFYAYGDLDALEVFREGARIVQFDHPQDKAWGWIGSVTSGAAAIAGFDYHARIGAGAPADLILFRARSWTELLARPQSDRIVLRAGKAIDTALPDYRELDDLMET